MIPYNLRQPIEKQRTVVQGRGSLVVCNPGVVRHFAVLAIELREGLDVIAGEGDRNHDHVFVAPPAEAA
jgi:hypothetical protein